MAASYSGPVPIPQGEGTKTLVRRRRTELPALCLRPKQTATSLPLLFPVGAPRGCSGELLPSPGWGCGGLSPDLPMGSVVPTLRELALPPCQLLMGGWR